jgi:hypothetical protein
MFFRELLLHVHKFLSSFILKTIIKYKTIILIYSKIK